MSKIKSDVKKDIEEIKLIKAAIMEDKRYHEAINMHGCGLIADVVNELEFTKISADAVYEVLIQEDFIKNIRKKILSSSKADNKLSDLQNDEGTRYITKYIIDYLTSAYIVFAIDNNYMNYAMTIPNLRETVIKALEKKITILRGLFPVENLEVKKVKIT